MKIFLKYFLFAGAIILLMGYMFTIFLPKSAHVAKEELIEGIFGITNNDTIKIESKDSIIPNKLGGYINNDINILEALKSCFNYHNIEITYIGIPESRIPFINEGELKWIDLNNSLRARCVKFKTDKGQKYNVYVIYDRLTGEVVDVTNDERFIVEKKDTLYYE